MKHKIFSVCIGLLFVFASNITFSEPAWQLVGTVTGAGPVPSICVVNSSTVFIFGGTVQPKVYRSTDGGVNFTTLGTTGLGSIPLMCGWAVDKNLIFAGEHGGTFYKTTNGRTSWTVVDVAGGPFGFINGIVFSRTTPMFGVAESDPPSGPGDPFLLWITTDGGSTWNKLISSPPGISGAMSVYNSIIVIDNQFFGFGIGYWFGGGSSQIYMTTNGGTSWSIGELGIPGNFVSGFAFSDDKMRGIAATPTSLPTIARTSDGGVTWSSINTNTGITGLAYRGFCKWIPGTDICYFNGGVGLNGVIAKSTDGGLTWTTMNTSGETVISHMDFYSGGRNIYGYAVTESGRVLRLDDVIPTTPQEKIGMLVATIDSIQYAGILNKGNANSLKTKLNNALKKINQGKFNTAINILNAFINGVEAFVNSNKLTQAQGEMLIERANAVIEQISGDNNQQFTEIPNEFKLYQNYSNPFNPTTNIKFDIPKSTHVKIIIYNAVGQEVAALVNEKLNTGSYEVDWNASGYPSGVYFYKLVTNDFVSVKKMILVK